MLSLIVDSCTRFADRTAFFIENKSYSYSDFATKVSTIRDEIEKFGGKELKNIGVEVYNDIETYSSNFGALFAGCAFVPLNPSNPIDRNLSVIEQSEIKLILTSHKNSEISRLASSKGIILIATNELSNSSINLCLPDVTEEDIAYILFTSGSTGIPKGVPISRKNLSAFCDAFYKLGYNVDENDRFLQMFELTFDFSIFTYIAPLCKGASVYTLPEGGIKYANVYSILEEHEITFAALVPSILTYLRPYFEEIRFDKLKYSLFCGEALVKDIVDEWQKCTPNSTIVNAYGPTEATVFCLIYNCSQNPDEIKEHNGAVSIGKEMENMKAIIADENQKQLSVGEKGELCLAGEQVTPGYWKNEEKNKEAFFNLVVDGIDYTFYRTGDLAYFDEDGDFMFSGRLDYQVKVDGFRIELGEIELQARRITHITNVVAVPIINKVGSTEIHLFVENYTGDTNEIKNILKENIPSYMVPSVINSVPHFPLNENGKVDRKSLIQLHGNI